MCGERTQIRPIWFVLQSQIKKESGEGEIARRCGRVEPRRFDSGNTHML